MGTFFPHSLPEICTSEHLPHATMAVQRSFTEWFEQPESLPGSAMATAVACRRHLINTREFRVKLSHKTRSSKGNKVQYAVSMKQRRVADSDLEGYLGL
eukprot:768593-Hanusia_phi.AAC.9